jgi:hypothetical protein
MAVPELLPELAGHPPGGDQQHPARPEPRQLLAQPAQRADPEDHPAGQRLVGDETVGPTGLLAHRRGSPAFRVM